MIAYYEKNGHYFADINPLHPKEDVASVKSKLLSKYKIQIPTLDFDE